MIALENDLERKKMTYNLYNGLESYDSVCHENMYFYKGGDTQT